jgi:alkanesulfonate monooxygenase SsuD/methylene tetrahydromethanopterin reductase-like flavin-dependent oxidoreductase (luciferase family)
VQSLETTTRRVALYRETMLGAGYDEAAVAANLEASWVWRNVFVAATDAEAERVGIPLFDQMTRDRAEMRNRYAAAGLRIIPQDDLPGQRKARGEGLLYGSAARVAEDYAGLERLGIGGVINTFRLGPMPHQTAAESLTRFMREVAPQFQRPQSIAAEG